MKKYFVMLVMLACIGTTSAQEQIVANDVEVAQGGQGILAIDMQLLADHDYVSYQLKVELPEGISLVADAYGNADFTLPESQPAAVFKITDFPASNGILKVASSPSTAIAAHEGTLVTIPVKADASLAIGTKLEGRISGVVFAHADATAQNFSDATFEIEVVENITVLDETSTTVPAAAENVKVLVKRTIKANEWSTICLPFDMTETQVKAAFGDDVQLAEYIEHEMNADRTALNIIFDDAYLSKDGLIANYPYIIKTSKDITEFTVDGVTIDPDEGNAFAEFTNGKSGSRKEVYGTFKGTYHAQTTVPANTLFLSDNQFWYSKGLTKMKAFRAYFDIKDVLASVEGANSRISYVVGNSETTGISSMHNAQCLMHNEVYDLQGRRMNSSLFTHHSSLKKGLYIKNGRKEVVR